jgi:hypothetical protein
VRTITFAGIVFCGLMTAVEAWSGNLAGTLFNGMCFLGCAWVADLELEQERRRRGPPPGPPCGGET